MSPSSSSTFTPEEVAYAMIDAGIKKYKDRSTNTLLKAFMAGAMLSFGGLLSEIIQGGATGLASSNPGIVKVLGGFVFPVGLVMIVLQGQELVTSNMMIFPIAVAKGAIPWTSLPINWIIVMFGNLAGSLFFGAIIVHSFIFQDSGILAAEPYRTFVQTFALHKARDPAWHQIFLRGVACNWLVSVAIWQAAGARDTISKIIAIWIPIWVFVACGFDHVVANMFSVPLGIMFGAPLSVAEYIRKSFIAAFLGNVVGAALVALPAVYMYLGDYSAGGLMGAEMGTVERVDHSNSGSSSQWHETHDDTRDKTG